MICAYFYKKDLPILSTLRLIPVEQILDIAENLDSYPIQKLNEVLLKIIFRNLEPDPSFNFWEEIQKVNKVKKLLSFKKLVVKKFMFGRVHAIRKIKKLKILLEKLKKEEVLKEAYKPSQSQEDPNNLEPQSVKNSQEEQKNLDMAAHVPQATEFLKLHSNLIVIFQDKVFMLVLREIYNMNANVEIFRNLTNILPDKTLEMVAKIWFGSRKGNDPFIYKMLSSHLNEGGATNRSISMTF